VSSESAVPDRLYLPWAPAPAQAEAVTVPMRDGVGLHADVYLPKAARTGRRVPAVLVRAPYGVREPFMLLPEIAQYITERGLAAVVQDVRGKFRSDGERIPFLNEVLDGYDTLEWVSQQPWCNGGVGMYGESYYGFTQWAAVASGHPALKAMAPLVTGSRLPLWHARPGVVPFFAAPVGWFAGTWESDSIFLREEADVLDFAEVPVLEVLGEQFPHARALVSELVIAPSATLLDLVYPSGLPAPSVRIPVFHRGGWWDNLKGSQLDDWHAVQHAPAAALQRLEMAAIDHYSEPYAADPGSPPVSNDQLDPQVAVERMVETAADFLDQHLSDRDAPAGPRVRVEIANAGWVEGDQWPLPNVQPLVWHLTSASQATADAEGGALSATADSQASTAHVTHNPGDLVPSLTVSDFHVLPVLPDESAVHARTDVMTFTSSVLREDLVILGPVSATFTARSSCRRVPFIVGLHHLVADRASLIVEGSRTACLGSQSRPVTVDLGDIGFCVPAGDRLRLSISVSRFPRFLPPSGTLDSDWLAEVRRPFEVWVATGGGHTGTLQLLSLPSRR
jgi:predicted acyl esterase